MTTLVDVDVRPILQSGGEPFSVIMAALDDLSPGQGLRLLATFKPVPLFAVMEKKGFLHQERAMEGGDWEILFTPMQGIPERASVEAAIDTMLPEQWPEPDTRLDNRGLEPPEPMVRILAAAEQLKPGATLSALLSREPMFLFPQLEQRGFRWLGGFTPDGKAYELTVRAPS